MKLRCSQCIYGVWCPICKTGFVSLTWEMKQEIEKEHKHEI